ncbi:MAG: hypothetical protein R2839_03380 [Thermomicrobiales bacterium]
MREGEHIAVGNGIDDGVGVEFVAKGLFGGAEAVTTAGIGGEDRCTGEAEEVIAPEGPGDGGVHFAELGAVHSSKTITTCPVKMACPLLAGALIKVDSFWMVVMMMRAAGSSSCFFRMRVGRCS